MAWSDVYEVSDELVRNLIHQNLIDVASLKFNKLKENYSKVDFVESILIDLKYLERLQNFKRRNEKCNKKSLNFRVEGNEQFSLKNYFQAMELYNKSICYSEPRSENLAIGYANRSAVLFEWKLYRECLQNIELARKANFPMHLMHKLDKREKDCKQLLDSQPSEVQPYDFKMNFNSHSDLPNIADCLEMRETPEEGRFICTTRDLAAGDLVATEEPFCSVLLPPMRYIRCANCKRENYLTLIPCEECCSAMFCSEECRKIAMNSFHKYECPIIDILHGIFNKIHLIALRVCLSAIELFPTIEELMNFCNDPENQNKSVFDLDYTNLTRKEQYRAIHGLVTNQHLRSISDLFQRSVVCAILKHFIIEYTPLKEFLGGKDGQNFFTELLFRHLQTSAVNMHNISLIEQVNETKDDVCHSCGAYPFLSLLKHSCARDTVRVYKGTKTYLFVLRPIHAGEAVHDNYGSYFVVHSKTERMERLSEQYLFKCSCEACKNNYPNLFELPSLKNVPDVNNRDDRNKLIAYDYNFALENYKTYCKILNKHASSYPCQEIFSAEEYLKMALNILMDAVPLKAKNL